MDKTSGGRVDHGEQGVLGGVVQALIGRTPAEYSRKRIRRERVERRDVAT